MVDTVEIKVPDIGDFDEVDVVEVLVKKGDRVEVDESLITLESDKASMEVPSTKAGVVEEVLVSVGDKVGEGDVIVRLEAEAEEATGEDGEPESEPAEGESAATGEAEGEQDDDTSREQTESERERSTSEEDGTDARDSGDEDRRAAMVEERERREEAERHAGHGAHRESYDCDVLVLGSGPGGYTAAFRAADLGQRTVLVEKDPVLGGVCLNVGCIPSKALLHVAALIEDAEAFAERGVKFGSPEIDLDALRGWKDDVVGKLVGGLAQMAKRREVEVVTGEGRFLGPHELEVTHDGESRRIRFAKAIIAVGSRPVELPFAPDDPRIMDSTGALDLEDVPERLLVIGGGIIGLEMSTVYAALGSKVSVVELLDGLMPGADRDLVRVLEKRIRGQYENVWVATEVTAIEADDEGLTVRLDGKNAPDSDRFDRILVAVGRRPNGSRIDAERAGVEVDDRGFIRVDDQQRTNVPHIFAIGDVVGEPMLAHKATHEGKAAAEVAAGLKSGFDARVIPSVAYTDPEVAWVGLTETEAKEQGIDYGKGVFPWAASGRSLAMGRSEGSTKLLFDPESGRVLGGGIVGTHAGDLIAEVGLAIEMGADAQDLGLTIHPHPTLSETVAFAAEAFEGTITDLYLPKKKSSKS